MDRAILAGNHGVTIVANAVAKTGKFAKILFGQDSTVTAILNHEGTNVTAKYVQGGEFLNFLPIVADSVDKYFTSVTLSAGAAACFNR